MVVTLLVCCFTFRHQDFHIYCKCIPRYWLSVSLINNNWYQPPKYTKLYDLIVISDCIAPSYLFERYHSWNSNKGYVINLPIIFFMIVNKTSDKVLIYLYACGDNFRYLMLSNQQSRTQRYIIYCHVKRGNSVVLSKWLRINFLSINKSVNWLTVTALTASPLLNGSWEYWVTSEFSQVK